MKTSKNDTRERRDWTLLIFIIPIAIILMLIAGQIAIRLVPIWSVNAGMQSNLDPNNLPMQQSGPLQPILPAILTPLGWLDTFLTPGADGYDIISDFIVINVVTSMPTTIPPVTKTVIPSTVIAQSTATIYIPPVTKTVIPSTVIAQPTATIHVPPPVTVTDTPIVVPTNTPIVVPTDTPIVVPTDTPIVVPTDTPTTVPTDTPTTVPTGYPSTPDPSLIPVNPVPPVVVGNPDGTITNISPGSFTVVDITSSPIIVVGPSENTYDLVYNEAEFNGTGGSGLIYLDSVILGISMFPDGHIYYDIFNWGNGVPDLNTNISGWTDMDNQIIPMVNLWSYPGTGVEIDADNAPSLPPPGSYPYLVVISPPRASTQFTQIDSILIYP